GLSQPWVERYFDWLGNFITGNLGNSVVGLAQGAKNAPVSKLIDGPIVNSFVLATIAGILMVVLSLGLGVVAAVRAGKATDHAINNVTLAAISLPEFVLGSVLIVLFFVNLGLFSPVALVPPGKSPLDHPSILVLPVLTLLGASCASGIRMVRSGMLGALRSEYVETARLNGLPEHKVVRYALRNALAPSVQIFAQNLQWLIGGIIITENLFAYPGLGMELVNSVENRDVTVVQSTVMLIAIFYVLVNIIADLLVMLLVPRLREQ
ncbi:MAG: ABC transporter permease, partial [Solirubrobacteraceae bacterium]